MQFTYSKKVAVCLVVITGILSDGCFSQSAKHVLGDILDFYASADKFSCKVTVRQIMKPSEIDALGEIAFVRSGKTTISWTITPFDPTSKPVHQLIVGDDTSFVFLEDGIVHRESSSLERAIIAATGVSHGLAFHMPSILLGGMGQFNLRTAYNVEFGVDERYGERFLTVIRGNTNAGAFEMAFSRSDRIIYRLKTPLTVETYDDVSIETAEGVGP